ncbi:MAG TPA: lysylphosphatidylglycerol synthase transmembrane domain-containing protein [Candidatus Dormibacteraeota bacterium]|jgi:hypothetical protein
MRQRRRARWKLLGSVPKIAGSAGLLAWLLSRTDLGSIGRSLSRADWTWLAIALLLSVTATLVQARQWQRLLRAVGLERTTARSLRIVFVGTTFNAILPSSIGGDAARAVLVARGPGERAAAAVAVVMQRLLNLPGMVLLLGLGLALTATTPAAARTRPLALLGAGAGLALVGVALSPAAGRVASSARLSRLPGWSALSSGLRLLDEFRARRAELAAAGVRGVLFWSLAVLNHWAYMQAVGVRPSLGYAAVAVTLVNGLTMLPISINGYGARESGYVALLAGVGLATSAQAFSVGLLVSGQSLLLGLVGVACLLGLRGSPARPTATTSIATALRSEPGATSLGGRGRTAARQFARLDPPQYASILALLAMAVVVILALMGMHIHNALDQAAAGR